MANNSAHTAGLPDRAAYSGQLLANGELVAPEIGALAPAWQTETLDGSVDFEHLRGAQAVRNEVRRV